jgi:hypothetical protein
VGFEPTNNGFAIRPLGPLGYAADGTEPGPPIPFVSRSVLVVKTLSDTGPAGSDYADHGGLYVVHPDVHRDALLLQPFGVLITMCGSYEPPGFREADGAAERALTLGVENARGGFPWEPAT